MDISKNDDRENIAILSDSQAALLQANWCVGHKGIKGNELTNLLGKEAAATNSIWTEFFFCEPAYITNGFTEGEKRNV